MSRTACGRASLVYMPVCPPNVPRLFWYGAKNSLDERRRAAARSPANLPSPVSCVVGHAHGRQDFGVELLLLLGNDLFQPCYGLDGCPTGINDGREGH